MSSFPAKGTAQCMWQCTTEAQPHVKSMSVTLQYLYIIILAQWIALSHPSMAFQCAFYCMCRFGRGTAVAQWLKCCATNHKVAGSIPAGVSGFLIDIKSFQSHYGTGVDSASNRNEYQEYFLGGKSGRCVRLTTLPPSCAVVMKFGNLNFLEPSGPLQACNGTDLPLLTFSRVMHWLFLSLCLDCSFSGLK